MTIANANAITIAIAIAIAIAFAHAIALLMLANLLKGRKLKRSVNSPPRKTGNLLMVVSVKARQFSSLPVCYSVQVKSDSATREVRCMVNHGLDRPCRGYFLPLW